MLDVIYIATPYSVDPQKAFDRVNKLAAKLILEGNIVFSPVSHTHHMADHMSDEQRVDHDIWMPQDLYWLAHCTKMIVIGTSRQEINDSKGCVQEMNYALDNNITIEVITE